MSFSTLPEANPEDHRIMRQALAGMIWCKQFFHYDVEVWLKGDRFPPPASRRYGRNRQWKHLKAGDVISMPDSWEYPWFAAWDLAFHCGLALIDIDFAKDQIELMLSDLVTRRYRKDIPHYWRRGAPSRAAAPAD